ncbi:FAD-dependent oxidoreductase [Conexibacter stalactiti]|uniref:FAD-dependent oxidoreductase n=1 Tax=Conexibacter stalactiti TaxID=1940611 RepID=A0ABU4HUV9_9ACTN|nr:FAD-dependent oxidoreductase [Conexibacter stalactiti]MDW5597096.1 FAD-dependent oxidoreductase [Conexibacter stalactiti]MEC5037738.1 FAD-dependent oxidoreductase [Conexibacter stalactiti]
MPDPTPPSLDRVLVVGASLAGLRAAEALRAEGFTGALTILGEESRRPYDRPPLSKELLAGEQAPDDVMLRGADELDAEWLLGDAAVALDSDRRLVATAGGRALPYDGLVIATGSAPRRLPAFDVALPNVLELRTLDDAQALRAALKQDNPHLLLVGCGFVGVEVAATARALGAEVTIVSLDPPIAVAGEAVSGVAAAMLEEHGVTVMTGRTVTETVAGERFEAAVLDDGTRIDADVVVVAVGALPCTEWLEGSGVRLDNGVVCDASLAAVGVERVVAAGDVARWPNPLFGGMSMRVEHWTNAVEGAVAAARTLLNGSGPETEYGAVPSVWSDHFGVRLQTVGLPAQADRIEVVEGSVEERRFCAVAYREGRLIGALAYSMPKALVRYRIKLARGAYLAEPEVAA